MHPFHFRYSISWLCDKAVTNRTVPGNSLQRVASFSPEKKILLELEYSDEAGCELQFKKGKIDYITEANTTIKKEKLSFPKQEISMPLQTLNDIINGCQLYQCIATQGMIYQISS